MNLESFYKKIFFLTILLLGFIYCTEYYLISHSWSKSKAISSYSHAVPSLSPLTYLQSNWEILKNTTSEDLNSSQRRLQEKNLFPLSGVSKAFTIVCQEEEELSYISDRFGFNNEDSLWENQTIDIAFLGDSYIQGYCVEPKNHFIKLLSTTKSILNLGLYGSGPLSELAILMEYAALKKPKVVIWTYMSNDLSQDLMSEYENSILVQYLQGKKQNLASQPIKIARVQNKIIQQINLNHKSSINLLSLSKVREKLTNTLLKRYRIPYHPTGFQTDYLSHEPINWLLYSQILKKADEIVKSWDGQLYFMYLPESGQWNPKYATQMNAFKKKLFKVISDNKIEIIDFSSALSKTSNPLDYYSIFKGQYGHYNVGGQQLLFNYLTKQPVAKLFSVSPN